MVLKVERAVVQVGKSESVVDDERVSEAPLINPVSKERKRKRENVVEAAVSEEERVGVRERAPQEAKTSSFIGQTVAFCRDSRNGRGGRSHRR